MNKDISVIPAKAGISLAFLRGIPAFAGMTVLFALSLPVQAAPFIYAPANCDFSVTFPEKPFIEKKCADETCVEVVTYTQMSEASSLNFRTTCNAQSPKTIDLLKPEDLKTTLLTLVKEARLEAYTSDSALLADKTKTAVAMASGRRGDRDVIYIGQLWAGTKSVLTIEGEMLGPKNKKIEDTFMEILQSLHSKTLPPAMPKPKSESKK